MAVASLHNDVSIPKNVTTERPIALLPTLYVGGKL